MTEGLVCPQEFVPAPSMMASFADSSQFPWMQVALQEFHTRETRGARHTPRILEYHATCAGGTRDDETAWCSAFANWVMAQIGLEGTGRANARSWLTWGNAVPTNSYHYGAVTVLWRVSKRSWKGHVAFLAGVEGDNLILLGGNQGDAVSLRPYPKSRLLSFRWPEAFPQPNMSVAV
ncbi:MAG: TIGR02594 family protein [Erythrobacter sp.]|nr:MAG: TIGR02594 family protein [Erythrobacter sp.]